MEFLGRSSELHIDRNPIGQPVSVLVVDPADTTRFIQLRGHGIPAPGEATRSWLAVRRLTLDAIHS
jgi:hypothetical protein